MQVPTPVPVRAQIDVGSGISAIDPRILDRLDLRPVGKRSISTPSTGKNPHVCDEYVVSISLRHEQESAVHPTVIVIESEFLQEEAVQALLGRDVLASYFFTYDGPGKKFSLRF